MRSQTFLSKTTSVIVGLALAICGSLTTVEPAHADIPDFTFGESVEQGPNSTIYSITNIMNATTLYWVIAQTSSNPNPTQSQVILGTGFSNHGSRIVPDGGARVSLTISDLTENTAYTLFVVAEYEISNDYTLKNSGSFTFGARTVTEQVTRSVERVIETPKFQAPLFNSLAPQGFTGLGNNGGRLVLKDIKVAEIKSVTLNGALLTVVESKSGSAVKIPAGAKAGDLIFAMADGTSITVPNIVKINSSQVDEKLVDLKGLPKFSGSSTSVPTSIATALTKQKSLIASSTSAKCVGYATANTTAAKATALARATNVCAVITNINESIEPIIKVVVNKTIAKKSAVRYLTW